ncbi:MAG TPA: 5-dehydro-2-deoxygluconokinase [Steroidobacteraceae bacterium]
MSRKFDLICLGRAAVDLYGQQIGGRLEDVQSFAKYLGGSSANLAAGTARLGIRSSMLTRVGDEQMGRFVREALAREGVDVSHVKTDPDRLTGLVILGIEGDGAYPHIFFRERCADMGLTVEDFDEAYIASSRALAVTGTHLSTPTTRAAVLQAFHWARANGTRTIFDIDYRPVLWKLARAGEGASRFIASGEVTAVLQELLPLCDLVVGTEEEIMIAGGASDPDAAVRSIRSQTTAPIIIKRGAAGCSIVAEDGSMEHVPGFPVAVLNVLGAGDAFLSGFLYGWLGGHTLAESARFGNACGALVVSRHGCAPAMPSEIELKEFLERSAQITRPDLDDRLAHIHHATTVRRSSQDRDLYVLAFDHRRQLEQLADESGAPRAAIAQFKNLIAAAVERTAQAMREEGRLGAIVDSRHGAEALARLTHAGLWVGRPIEAPGSRPLAFDPDEGTALHLASWPAAHVIKCLAFYHPDDPIELRLAQERKMRELYHNACRLDRDLLIEIVCSASRCEVDDMTLARAIRRLYNLGLRPAWWKLESQTPAAWQNVVSVIKERDPWCNGILLLGLDAPEHVLQRAFEDAAPVELCRGFAVGRSIFNSTARAWFAGSLSDAAAIDEIAERYARLISTWQEARRRVSATLRS